MKTITGIHGVPRSGTSWLAQIFNASPQVRLKFQPLFSYAFKDIISESSTSKDISDFFDAIYHSDDDFINMRDTSLLKSYPKFNKNPHQTHLVFKHVRYHFLLPHLMKENDILRLILIIRNPLSVLSSWKNAPREFNPSWNFNEEWQFAKKKNVNVSDYFGFEKWKEATHLFMDLEKAYPKRVKLITYNSVLNNTLDEVQKLYKFAGIEMTDQCLDFIHESKTRQIDDPNSVYKVKKTDDSFKKNIPLNIQETIIENLKGTELEQFLII